MLLLKQSREEAEAAPDMQLMRYHTMTIVDLHFACYLTVSPGQLICCMFIKLQSLT